MTGSTGAQSDLWEESLLLSCHTEAVQPDQASGGHPAYQAPPTDPSQDCRPEYTRLPLNECTYDIICIQHQWEYISHYTTLFLLYMSHSILTCVHSWWSKWQKIFLLKSYRPSLTCCRYYTYDAHVHIKGTFYLKRRIHDISSIVSKQRCWPKTITRFCCSQM